MIAPAPWPELNLEPFPDAQAQRLAAWQAVGMAKQILPEREHVAQQAGSAYLLSRYYSWGWRGPCTTTTACTDPYLVPCPSHGLPQEPGISLPCSWFGLSLAANLSGQGRKMGHVESFSLLQISLTSRRPLGLHLSCSRLRCRDWSVPRTVPFATSLGQSLCASHRASTQQRHAPPEPSSPSPGLPRPVGPRRIRTALVPLLVQIPPALQRLLGGAVRPRSRLRSWGRVAVTSRGPALPVIRRYVPPLERINRATGLPAPTGGDAPIAKLVAVVCSRPQSPSSPPRAAHPTCSLARCRPVHSLCWPGVSCSCTHRVPFSLCLVLVCIRWPPPCVLVELSSSQRFLSTGNRARQHIKMGHTLRAASLDLHLSSPCPSLPSNPMLFPSLFPAVIPFPGGNWAGSQGSPAPQSDFLQ